MNELELLNILDSKSQSLEASESDTYETYVSYVNEFLTRLDLDCISLSIRSFTYLTLDKYKMQILLGILEIEPDLLSEFDKIASRDCKSLLIQYISLFNGKSEDGLKLDIDEECNLVLEIDSTYIKLIFPSLPNFLQINLKTVKCTKLKYLENLIGIPESVNSIYIKDSEIKSLIGLPKSLKTLYIELCSFLRFSDFSVNSLDYFYIDRFTTFRNFSGIDLSGVRVLRCLSLGFEYDEFTILPDNYFITNNCLVGPEIDFCNANLTGFDLRGVDLSLASLARGTFVNVQHDESTKLPKGYFFVNNCILGPGVSLNGADFSGIDFSGLNLEYVDFTGANIKGARFVNVKGKSKIYGVSSRCLKVNNCLVGSYLNLENADLSEGDLSEFNLCGINLKGANLRGVNFRNADLTGGDLTGADISGADLRGAIINDAKLIDLRCDIKVNLSSDCVYFDGLIFGPFVDLSGADLRGLNLTLSIDYFHRIRMNDVIINDLTALPAGYRFIKKSLVGPKVIIKDLKHGFSMKNFNLSDSLIENVNFSRFNFNNTIFTDCVMNNVSFCSSKLSSSSFSHASLNDVDFSRANLKNSKFSDASLVGVDFTDAILVGVDFTGANLQNVDFSGADLTGANLTGVNLTGANLAGAILTEANLSEADLTGLDLSGINFSHANLKNTILTGSKLVNSNLSFVDLHSAGLSETDLSGVNLVGTSLLGVDFMYACMNGARVNKEFRGELLFQEIDIDGIIFIEE